MSYEYGQEIEMEDKPLQMTHTYKYKLVKKIWNVLVKIHKPSNIITMIFLITTFVTLMKNLWRV